jgi:hypothetical protein
MNIKVMRMWSGEDVVAEVLAEDDDFLTIRNSIVAVPAGQGQIGFAPWSPLLNGKDVELKIQKAYVVYVSEPNDSIQDQYKDMFSVITTPPKSGLIL